MRLTHPAVRLVLVALVLSVTACGFAFSPGPRPRDLAGIWFDSSTATATDSSFWMLTPDGEQRTFRSTIVRGVDGNPRLERNETGGVQWWYVTGRLSDTTHRALCFTVRPRRDGACYRFDVDTVMTTLRVQRRLTVYGYPINRPHHLPIDRVLLEQARILR